jgi:drug/metabolite transporter (DMT)-like permease
MDAIVFIVIIFAAAGHAAWNSLLKHRIDPTIATTMLAIGGGLVAMPVLFLAGMPEPAARPYILASILVHIYYWSYLGKAYAAGDLGQVYPIARGTAPLLTGLGAIFAAQEYPKPVGWAGILVVVAGVIMLAVFGGRGLPKLDRSATRFAVVTALSITGYSLVDGLGARQAGSAVAYTAFLYVCNGWALLIYGLIYQRKPLFEAIDGHWHLGLLTGGMSLLFYGVGVWAMTHAPIALVAALRETSILFALLLGTIMLKEPVRFSRVVGAVVIFAGLVLVRIG